MGTIYHDILEKGDRHALHDLGYTNQANRKAGAGISSIHLNRIVEQEDDRSFWIISQVSPSIIMDPYVPPAPALGDIGKVLTVASDADSYVKFEWAAPTSADIFDDIYNNESGTHTIYVDDGDMFWQLAGTNSFELDLANVTNTSDGFMVSNGTDQFDLLWKAANSLDLDADLRACDISASLVLALSGASGASIVAAGATSDLTFGARSASINLNESGDTTLGTTKQTLVGAINEINALIGSGTFDDIYNNESGTHDIDMDDGDVSWNCNTTNDFVVDVTSSSSPVINGATVPYGFSVENGADYFKIGKLATDQIIVRGLVGAIDLDASSVIRIDSSSTIEWSGTNASLSSAGALAIASDFTLTGGGSILSTSAGDITIEPNTTGNVGIGAITPSYKLSIGSTDGTKQAGIYHDNTAMYFKTNFGPFVYLTDEGTNSVTYVDYKGKGTGNAVARFYDQDELEYMSIYSSVGKGYIGTAGTAPGALLFQSDGQGNVEMFTGSIYSEGTTPALLIYGYKTGDTGRGLTIGISSASDDTAAFDGVSNYYFDGKVDTNSDVIRVRTSKTPASAAATGNVGDIAWDSSYIYVCVATDTWERAAIATW